MGELRRRAIIGIKLRDCRHDLGLSLDKACELIGRKGQGKKLLRIETPKGDRKGNQGRGGASMDFLFLEDLARLYGKNLDHFLSQTKVRRLRTKAEVLAAAKENGIRRTNKGKRRTFALVDGTYATVGSAFERLRDRGAFVETVENGVTVYRLPKK